MQRGAGSAWLRTISGTHLAPHPSDTCTGRTGGAVKSVNLQLSFKIVVVAVNFYHWEIVYIFFPNILYEKIEKHIFINAYKIWFYNASS